MGLYKVYDKFRRYWRQIHMLTIRDGWKKMAYIKRHGMLLMWLQHIIENIIGRKLLFPVEYTARRTVSGLSS